MLREGGRAGVGHVLSGFGEDVFHSRRLTPSYCTYSSRRARFGPGQEAGRPRASHAFPAQPNLLLT